MPALQSPRFPSACFKGAEILNEALSGTGALCKVSNKPVITIQSHFPFPNQTYLQLIMTGSHSSQHKDLEIGQHTLPST